MNRVLVVDDDQGVRFFLSEFLKKEGLQFDLAGDGREALSMLRAADYSLVLLDEKMPGMGGLEVLREMKSSGMRMPVIMITAYGSRQMAMRAMEEGAYDFFTKPVDLDTVRTVIRRALERHGLRSELEGLKAETALRDEVVAESPAMKTAVSLSKKVAETGVTVFIAGESGSGKELIARAIHRLSSRREAAFISVNCAAIPEGLLESELFGYEKGAFTGAHRQHIGKFERASGGTIFLDEIGDLPMSLQAKLLRALQDKVVERLGGKTPIKVDLRVISASNKDLSRLAGEGLFREDLLYRIKVFEIRVPPLRERKEDIPLLAAHFLKKYSSAMGREMRGISAPALRLFMDYGWPGNVREMENVIQRAIIVEEGSTLSERSIEGIIQPSWPTLEGRKPAPALGLKASKDEEEKRLIEEALARARWKRQEAASILGISRKSLFLKMRKHGLG